MSDAQTPMSNAAPYAGGVALQEDPGRTLGIVGLVLSIVASWIGLIISVVAFRKSKNAGFRNGLAKAGIIVGCITTALGLIGGVIAIVAAVHLGQTCSDLGPGVHQVGSGVVTCS
ncbi:hypothetical protein FOE78_02010 [Microlunatus elymi]|uniref:DUF4190 domain-containing protein n=1 Tax=Microlunatus elymi TaxID=2596828 RepID=A0A516PUN1_9ACTN|nr:hypothetical protein [Microlunatus elymi]QDP94853.1 hypothetical protein FOE78_02010 [Microlunatus elymi]